MPIQDAEELFITVLSNVRAREERTLQIWQEWSQLAEREDVKEILDTRSFLTRESIHNLDEAFRLLGKQPVQPTGTRLHDVFVEDFRREYNEIPSPQLKGLYVIHKARELVQLQISAYIGLIAMSDFMGDIPVSALLETNMAAEMVFVERTKALIRAIGEAVIARKMRKAA